VATVRTVVARHAERGGYNNLQGDHIRRIDPQITQISADFWSRMLQGAALCKRRLLILRLQTAAP